MTSEISEEEEKKIEREKMLSIQKGVGHSFAGKGGIFEKSVELALKNWDKKTPFIALDVGCGGGQSQIPLIKLLIEMIREKEKDAMIKIYQMDYISDEEAQEHLNGPEQVRQSASKWLVDENIESFFMAHSFYDPYDFSKAVRTDGKDRKIDDHENVKINLLFSQSCLHWVPELQKLSMEYFRSEEARNYSITTMSKIIDQMIPSLSIGGIVSMHFMGIIDGKGWNMIENTVNGYTHAFEAGFGSENKAECDLFLSKFLPQIPRRMDDIKKDLSERKEFVELLESGEMLMEKRNFEMTPVFAQTLSKSMLGFKKWRDRFEELFGENSELSIQEVYGNAGKKFAERFLKKGLFLDYTLMYFVFIRK